MSDHPPIPASLIPIPLKPCPFCGSPAQYCQTPAVGEDRVRCTNLNCKNHYDYSVEFWNARAQTETETSLLSTLDAYQELVTRLGSMVDKLKERNREDARSEISVVADDDLVKVITQALYWNDHPYGMQGVPEKYLVAAKRVVLEFNAYGIRLHKPVSGNAGYCDHGFGSFSCSLCFPKVTEKPVALPERDPAKSAEQQGVFRKFDVRHVDGSDHPGGKHHGCEYFVLDVVHDQHAKRTLAAYAESCEAYD